MMKKKIWELGMTVLLLTGVFWLARTGARLTGADAGAGNGVVLIDSGHGGSDPGKIGIHQEKEKDINLQIAKRLKKQLEKNRRGKQPCCLPRLSHGHDRLHLHLPLCRSPAVVEEQVPGLLVQVFLSGIKYRYHVVLCLILPVERLQGFQELLVVLFFPGKPKLHHFALFLYFHAHWAVISSPIVSSIWSKIFF